uniref:Uncharacterized protein n=1 Tax=Anguilla anguilla TaxID=7936 RepID=A0A0E9RK68_ANGAN
MRLTCCTSNCLFSSFPDSPLELSVSGCKADSQSGHVLLPTLAGP